MKVTYYPVGDYQANCVILSDESGCAVVIDPGDEAPRLLQRLADQKLRVAVILLTHAHFDHLLAVRELQTATGAALYIHTEDASALSDTRRSLIPPHRLPYELTADRLLIDGDTVVVGELMLSVLHTPGHTPGSCCYQCDNVLISGDTLFAGSVGRTDLPGGRTAALLQSLRRLATLPPELRVIPGHGEATTIGYECRYNPFLAGV
ncbi:MAG: MBL fold metallo-hydrolase [Clostridia bacterium]|nr:MBL fold metallo-hydrolase [Clostridia bacterium]